MQIQGLVRVMRLTFVLAGLAFFYVEHTIKPTNATPADPIVYKTVSGFAIVNLFLGIAMQKFMLRGAARRLPDGRIATPAQRWFSATIVRLAITMSTCLFGLVLHFLLAPERLVQALMLAGILFMMLPLGRPPAEQTVEQPLANSQ